MTALGNIIKKEMKELLTPATILPIVLITIIFASLGNAFGGMEEQVSEKPKIGVINEQEEIYSNITTDILQKRGKIIFNSSKTSEEQKGIEKLKKEEGAALLLIPHNFSDRIKSGQPGIIQIHWIMKGTGLLESISSESVERLLSIINTNLSKQLIENKSNTSINSSTVLQPTDKYEITYLKGKQIKGLSPNQISSILSSQSTTIPLIIMMIIVIAGGMVISSMALEKENKTLETLLTLPVKRMSIVTGKIAASAIIGLILASVYMIGMGYYMQSFQPTSGLNLQQIGLNISTLDFALIGVSLFVTLVAGLSLCMLFGTFAKNYKSAQTLTFPVTIMALFSMFLTMFTDFGALPLPLKAIVFAIPFTHPMMAPNALLFGNYLLVLSGIIYLIIFTIIIISIVAWVFKTDKLLTGSISKKQLINKIKSRIKR